ncbi:AGAP006706-PA-like protein [Anopheles sinensis]|uniref:AGAP006706-PA-like protein n=1 Tax=Anopheles sinensis TaxID=74873 RepID=A0A084WLL9_ANOSI|nr:AGAP006706-PA-like protein [Anopheles sinensis]
MNCSCASERCPHLQYLRTLLETSGKDQVPSCAVSRQTSTSENVALWQRWKPYVERTIQLSGLVIETVMLLWVAVTRGALQLWLKLLDADRYEAFVLHKQFRRGVVPVLCPVGDRFASARYDWSSVKVANGGVQEDEPKTTDPMPSTCQDTGDRSRKQTLLLVG